VAHPRNTQFSVAVHLLTLLADAPGQILDSQALSMSPATNPAHVRRVLGLLREEGLVLSRPGVHGGWTLAEAPKEIDLGEVWRAVHGEDEVLGIHDPDPDCATGRLVSASLRAIDRLAFDALVAELSHVTVADVLAGAVTAELTLKT
jgi:Rrf2 family protein